ncbi:MAG: hypothetical protein ABIF09_07035, partial [Gemmatimonadota bacterium]
GLARTSMVPRARMVKMALNARMLVLLRPPLVGLAWKGRQVSVGQQGLGSPPAIRNPIAHRGSGHRELKHADEIIGLWVRRNPCSAISGPADRARRHPAGRGLS